MDISLSGVVALGTALVGGTGWAISLMIESQVDKVYQKLKKEIDLEIREMDHRVTDVDRRVIRLEPRSRRI